MKATIIILFAIGSFISCRPARDLSFEIMSPATINLPDTQGKYLIFNSSYLPDSIRDPANQITFLSEEERINVDTLITKQVFDGLFSILNESPVPGLYSSDYLELRTSDTTGFLKQLSPIAVSEICKDNKADYLISFEYYSYDHYIYCYPTLFYGYSHEAVFRIRNSLLWRIYGNDGKLIDDYEFRDTLYWNSLGNYDDEQNIQSDELEYISEAFRIAGNEYGKRITPHWENVNRSLYDIIEKTDTGRVITTMDKNRLQVSGMAAKRTKAYKACYNMSVLYESEGDINNALSWIDRAMIKKHNSYARKYKEILQNRLKIIEILNKQTGQGN